MNVFVVIEPKKCNKIFVVIDLCLVSVTKT